MDMETFKLLVNQGGLAAFAFYALFQVRVLARERAQDLKAGAERQTADFQRLESLHRETIDALRENARALARFVERRTLERQPSGGRGRRRGTEEEQA